MGRENYNVEILEPTLEKSVIEYKGSTIELTHEKEGYSNNTKQTVVRFNRYPTSASKNYLINQSLGYETNVIDIHYVFNDLDTIYEEAISLVNSIEDQVEIEVVGIELPFSDKVRLSSFLMKSLIGGSDLQILRPVFDEVEKRSSATASIRETYRKERQVISYEVFDEYSVFSIEETALLPEQSHEVSEASVLRYTRHPIQNEAVKCLQEAYGAEVAIVTHNEIIPSRSSDFLEKLKDDVHDQETQNKNVVAVELIAPLDLTARMSYDRYLHDKGISLVRPHFKKTDIDYVTTEGEVFSFDTYQKIQPSFQFFKALEPRNYFETNDEMTPIRCDEENSEEVQMLSKTLDEVLRLMSQEKWDECKEMISDENINSLLEDLGIHLNVHSRIVDSYSEFEKSNESMFDGENAEVTFELLELSPTFATELKNRNMDVENIINKLKILNVFTRVEELLHVLQQVGNDSLLSKEGQMLYAHPYLENFNHKNRNATVVESLSKEYLAFEFDIPCIYKGYNIKIPPYFWHSYQRMDILHQILGEDLKGVFLEKIKDDLEKLRFGESKIFSEIDLENYQQDKKIIGKKSGNHCFIEKSENEYLLSYPKQGWSGWGIFYAHTNGTWKLVKENECIRLLPGDKLRFGPSVYVQL
jgi:hypothetical protein